MSLPATLYSTHQVRELDRIAIQDFGIPGFTLMKRAAKATFDCILDRYPSAKSLSVICGTGNNGGDGYVIATLAYKAGLKVNTIQLGNSQLMTGDALLARNEYQQNGGLTSDFQAELLDVDIIVDAIFGTGLTRPVEGEWATVIEAINASKASVVAVDVPSGLNSDSGVVLGHAIKANMTVTYIGVKSGLLTGQARDYVGELKFDDLQVPAEVYQALPKQIPSIKTIPHGIAQKKLKPRSRCSHKGDHGHVLLIGGQQGMSGAIRLAGEACLRAGAGLVSVATDVSHASLINNNRPELMVSGIQQPEALRALVEKASVIAIGPGLGQSEWAQDLLLSVLASDKPKVLDADALNLLAKFDDSHLTEQTNNWILTPHPAEAARLLGETTAQIENNRYQAVGKMYKKWGGVCLLKGAGTLVSNGSVIAVCTAGNPGMASGGMGDVLTGIIAALVAQGLSSFDAASTAVQIHAQAADLAANQGERGLLGSDLFPYIRALVNP